MSAVVAAGSPEGWAPAEPNRDHFVVVHGVTWAGYCLMRDLLDGPGVGLTFLEGALEPAPFQPEAGKSRPQLLPVGKTSKDR